jgi:hypothetical protein
MKFLRQQNWLSRGSDDNLHFIASVEANRKKIKRIPALAWRVPFFDLYG